MMVFSPCVIAFNVSMAILPEYRISGNRDGLERLNPTAMLPLAQGRRALAGSPFHHLGPGDPPPRSRA